MPSSPKNAVVANEGRHRPLALLELSTAGREWEEWEGVADDAGDETKWSEAPSNDVDRTWERRAASREGNIAATEAEESVASRSDSDGSEEGGDSFLTPGGRPLERAVGARPGPARKAGVASLEKGAPGGTDEDDGVDWEDGDADEDCTEGEAGEAGPGRGLVAPAGKGVPLENSMPGNGEENDDVDWEDGNAGDGCIEGDAGETEAGSPGRRRHAVGRRCGWQQG